VHHEHWRAEAELVPTTGEEMENHQQRMISVNKKKNLQVHNI